jgi:hypothetical protein
LSFSGKKIGKIIKVGIKSKVYMTINVEEIPMIEAKSKAHIMK